LLLASLLYCEDFFKIRKEVIGNAWKKVAFLYVQPAVTLENMGYTSNIYSFQELEEPDWTADIGLKLQVSSILGNRFVLMVNEHPFYSFYAENAEQRALSNRLKSTIHTYVGSINLEYSYNNDYIKGRPTSEFGAYVRMQEAEHLVSMDYGRHENFFLTLYLKQKKKQHLEENYLDSYNLKRFMNRKETSTGIGLNKIIFTQTLLFLNLEYYEYKFETESQRNGIGRQASIGIAFPEIGRIQGSAEFGIKYFNAGSSLYQNYSKPFGSGEVTIKLFKRFKFQLHYLVNNFYSFWSADQSFDEKSLGFRMEYYIDRNIKMGYHYQVGMLSYKNLTDGRKTREDRFYTTAFYLGLRIFKRMGIGLEYRMYRSDSDVHEFLRNSDFIGGYFIHEF
jgi:outer membrane receptor protein involved in Fe transport